MKGKAYAVNHSNLIVRTLESFRKLNQFTVEKHCNVTGINKRTYEAWLSGRRNPEADHIRWIAVKDSTSQVVGVLYKLEEYECPNSGRPRYYSVVFDRHGRNPEAGDGQSPFDSIVNAAQKAANLMPGISNSQFSVSFVPTLFSRKGEVTN